MMKPTLSQIAESGQPIVDPVIASIANFLDTEIVEMSRPDLMDLLRLSGQRFSTLDETQQLYAPLDRLQFFARISRDICRQQLAASQPQQLPR